MKTNNTKIVKNIDGDQDTVANNDKEQRNVDDVYQQIENDIINDSNNEVNQHEVEKETPTFVQPVQINKNNLGQRVFTKQKCGDGVTRLVPAMSGKHHGDVKEIKGPGHTNNLQAFPFIQQTRKKGKYHGHAIMNRITDVIFTQMLGMKGFKVFGERVVAAIFNASIQLDK